MTNLAGKTALVTGGSRGIGAAIARAVGAVGAVGREIDHSPGAVHLVAIDNGPGHDHVLERCQA